MAGRLAGKVAIVTGAGSSGPGWGNGKATAVLFAREGAKVLAVDLRLESTQETSSMIENEGGECVSYRADVSKADEVRASVNACMETFGRIDILHNNVGILALGGPEETSEEVWDHVMAVNIKSMFLTCKYVLPLMVRQREGGAIINVSSVASIRYTGFPSVAYNASKGAVNQLTQNIAVQYASEGIRANCVLPGLMDTPMIREPLQNAYGPGGMNAMVRQRNASVPLGKMGEAWDVAYASLFLASDEAKYVTGSLLVVDGGLTSKFS